MNAIREDARERFGSIAAGGLDWDSLPLRLFTKGNRRFWDPAGIDFERDAEHWAEIDPDRRRALTTLVAMFIGGEEAVTEDLQPFIRAMACERRLGDEMFLAQFCFEEARHVQGFRRWLDAVGLTGDLHALIEANHDYMEIFRSRLPRALDALWVDPGPAQQVRASIVYNHIVEGTLALTGYFACDRFCQSMGVLPGIQELVAHIRADERRHMAWGTYTCRRHVAASAANMDVAETEFCELLPLGLGALDGVFDRIPRFRFDRRRVLAYAERRAWRRMHAIRSARGRAPAEVELDRSPEHLEDAFDRQDNAIRYQVTT
jgi:ribonucleoside-diphosphate reductase beta chain